MRVVPRATRGAECALFLNLMLIILTAEARAHGTLGRRMFIEPFVGEDAAVKNELMLMGHYMNHRNHADGWHFIWEIEKTITDNTSLFIESGANFNTLPHDAMHGHQMQMGPLFGPMDGGGGMGDGDFEGHGGMGEGDGGMGDGDHDPMTYQAVDVEAHHGPEPSDGLRNLEVGIKHQVYVNERRETIFSLAAAVEAPTGTVRAGAMDHTRIGAMALLARGFGDLPRGAGLLRPFALQADAGVEASLGTGRADPELAWDVALHYDLSILHEHLEFPAWLERFVLTTEFNFETPLSGDERGETDAFVTSGIVWKAKPLHVGVAFQFPMNDGNEHRFVVMPMFTFFYDEVWPRLGRNLLP